MCFQFGGRRRRRAKAVKQVIIPRPKIVFQQGKVVLDLERDAAKRANVVEEKNANGPFAGKGKQVKFLFKQNPMVHAVEGKKLVKQAVRVRPKGIAYYKYFVICIVI